MKLIKDPPNDGDERSSDYWEDIIKMLNAVWPTEKPETRQAEIEDTISEVATMLVSNPVSQAAMEALRPIWAPYVFENFRPIDYPRTGSLVNDTISAIKGERVGPQYDSQGRLKADEEAFSMALGLPTENYYFQPSEYQPSQSTDANARYYRLNPNLIDADFIRSNYRIMDVGHKELAPTIDILLRNEIQSSGDIGWDPMENYTISIGEDDKGKYLSYYDKYDFTGPVNYVLKPFEIYDRIYFDEE